VYYTEYVLRVQVRKRKIYEAHHAFADKSRQEFFVALYRATEHRRIPGAHYASCPLLVVAMAPWIIPDLRMKRVFEEARRREE
jgi:hypothetical protein